MAAASAAVRVGSFVDMLKMVKFLRVRQGLKKDSQNLPALRFFH